MADVLRSPRFWLAPILVVSTLMSFLAALYLGGVLDPRGNLHDLPIAIVNQDEGDTLAGEQRNIGNDIVDGLIQNVDSEKVAFREVGPAQAESLLSTAEVYGSIVIPSDFTKRMGILAEGSIIPGDIEKPIITVYTNPRAGSFGMSLVTGVATPAFESVNQTVGQQITDQVRQQLGDTPLAGASALTLAQPIDVIVAQHDPLPDGTGGGLSAFYYALLLVLAGFTGATIVSTLVDGLLGFTPTEIGPKYIHRGPTRISRFQTLLVKWLVMFVLAMLVSALYLLISHLLSMPITHAWTLWMYGAFAITAVGFTALAVMSAFGTAGLLVNLVVFIILALPSSGGTIPLEASPPIFTWLAQFEPMHQIFLGTRSILYFNASPDAGLLHSVGMTSLGLLIGLVFGLVFTLLYDRKGLDRSLDSPGFIS
ncbi:DUF3533 domain-containing protein [Rhodococcus fascians]|nr:DUF3533 domain-containing protein [Rhodococcus fascians]MBY4114800.1 DUF3533 domain-containing protein [Rhodococcus fascians]